MQIIKTENRGKPQDRFYKHRLFTLKILRFLNRTIWCDCCLSVYLQYNVKSVIYMYMYIYGKVFDIGVVKKWYMHMQFIWRCAMHDIIKEIREKACLHVHHLEISTQEWICEQLLSAIIQRINEPATSENRSSGFPTRSDTNRGCKVTEDG